VSAGGLGAWPTRTDSKKERPTMDSIAGAARQVIGGVDTHLDLHHAAVVDRQGEILGTRSFDTTRAGYRAMLRWMRGYGELVRVGIEQSGSFGAGLTRHLALAGIPVLEVTGPDPAFRRAKGKDDTLDAIAAAKAALSGQRVSAAKDRSGQVEALRVLRVTRTTAVKCRRATLQTLRNTITAAPDEVRDQLRNLTPKRLLRTCAAWRPDKLAFRDPAMATKIACKSLATRMLELDDEISELNALIEPLVAEIAPGLLELEGVGTHNAGELLVAAGDNPDRLRSEAGFAMLCGTSPIPASSGKTQRHRLNRGGNRQANSALHMIVVCRMRTDQRTRDYVTRRLTEGKSKREIMRCLKRYVAREIYNALTTPGNLALLLFPWVDVSAV
jgi:transposase